MRRICGRNTRSAALATIVGTLATGTVVGMVSVASGHAAWAQVGAGSGLACQPGVRPGTTGGPGNGDNGILQSGAIEMRFCGERGREVYTMGGAPYVYEVQWTLEYFSPNTLPNPSHWISRFGPIPTLCSGVPSASDLPGAKLTARLITYDSNADASTTVSLSPDTDKPTLNTTSTPPKGTKVKPGDTIKIRLEASEEYSQDRRGWQTGVKKLQLIDESPKPVVTPHWEGGQPRACAAKQWKQFLEVTYTVPANPPPVIRLRAIGEDFAGNQDFDLAEFPTGDWFGTIKKTVKGGGFNYTVDLDVAFDVVDQKGTIKGRAHGKVRTQEDQVSTCTILWTFSPSEFEMPISGRREGREIALKLEPGPSTGTNLTTCEHGQHSSSAPLSPVADHTSTTYSLWVDVLNSLVRHDTPGPYGFATRNEIYVYEARR